MSGIREFLFIYDIAAVMLMLLISYLSRRLGEALKIPRYYRILYLTAFAIFVAFTIETIFATGPWGIEVPLTIRCSAGVVAFLATLRYWGWLLSEFLKP